MDATALIADDEEAPRAQLVAALRGAWPQLRVVAEAINGIDAWDAFLERDPQVCFLDVRMPGLTGLEVAQRIGDRAHVVFVAANGDQVLAAFDANDVEHLVKPLDPDQLAAAVERLRARLAAPPPDLRPVLDRLAGQTRRPSYPDMLSVGAGHDLRELRVDDIVWFESEARHTRVVHTEGHALIRTPLKVLLGQLDPAVFWQIHRTVIVNRRHMAGVTRIADGGMVVTLRGRTETLPVSRQFQRLFEKP